MVSDSLNAQVKSKPALKSKSIFYGSALKMSEKRAKLNLNSRLKLSLSKSVGHLGI